MRGGWNSNYNVKRGTQSSTLDSCYQEIRTNVVPGYDVLRGPVVSPSINTHMMIYNDDNLRVKI